MPLLQCPSCRCLQLALHSLLACHLSRKPRGCPAHPSLCPSHYPASLFVPPILTRQSITSWPVIVRQSYQMTYQGGSLPVSQLRVGTLPTQSLAPGTVCGTVCSVNVGGINTQRTDSGVVCSRGRERRVSGLWGSEGPVDHCAGRTGQDESGRRRQASDAKAEARLGSTGAAGTGMATNADTQRVDRASAGLSARPRRSSAHLRAS